MTRKERDKLMAVLGESGMEDCSRHLFVRMLERKDTTPDDMVELWRMCTNKGGCEWTSDTTINW